MSPEINFTNPEDGEAHKVLGSLVDKINDSANQVAIAKFGEKALLNPSRIEVSPNLVVDEITFIVRAWHETEGYPAGVVQLHDFTFTMLLGEVDCYMAVDDGSKYALTPREAVTLNTLGNGVMADVIKSLYINRDDRDEGYN